MRGCHGELSAIGKRAHCTATNTLLVLHLFRGLQTIDLVGPKDFSSNFFSSINSDIVHFSLSRSEKLIFLDSEVLSRATKTVASSTGDNAFQASSAVLITYVNVTGGNQKVILHLFFFISCILKNIFTFPAATFLHSVQEFSFSA